MNKSVLCARHIHKRYDMGKKLHLDVLKGIDMDIRSGEILAIMGPSGVGKSTLLHILGGLDRPTQGSVIFDDKDIFLSNDEMLARFRNQYIGFVFQFHYLLPEFTALENVAMPSLILRKNPKDVFIKAKKLLAEVDLKQRLQHKPRELSGGEQQRVAFARALINDPVLILADEPSGNLDMTNSQALHHLIWNLVRQKGKTFAVVTHNEELAARADRVVRLHDGKIKM
jgi:lipoprotein-releasing system ATP-binding protein